MIVEPLLIKGDGHSDTRGSVLYNNTFDASLIKRIYTIQNTSTSFIRSWQGHKIEQRWFSAVMGAFSIRLIEIDNWNDPSKDLKPKTFIVTAETLDVLHIPPGYVSSIQSLESNSKLIAMSDYLLGEIRDEYRYEADYFMN
jgi:dTDP-4-dehydrorhamnose 3,5-epimerase-like enzyme